MRNSLTGFSGTVAGVTAAEDPSSVVFGAAGSTVGCNSTIDDERDDVDELIIVTDVAVVSVPSIRGVCVPTGSVFCCRGSAKIGSGGRSGDSSVEVGRTSENSSCGDGSG